MTLLCFGDSNTYGYDPRSFPGDRYPADVRWTGLLAKATGWRVLEAGQNGREIPCRQRELDQLRRPDAFLGPYALHQYQFRIGNFYLFHTSPPC